MRIFLFVLLFLSVFVDSVFAHGAYNYSQRQYVGENVVIVNYNVQTPKTDVPIVFNIRLYTLANGVPVAFDKAVVTFSLAGRPVNTFTQNGLKDVGINIFNTFRHTGVYTINVEYTKKGTVFVKASFPLIVEKGIVTGVSRFLAMETAVGFMLGVFFSVVFFFFLKYKGFVTYSFLLPPKKKK